MESELINLFSKEIGVHPIIAYLEKEGAFNYKENELRALIESVKRDGFLQPILVTPAPEPEKDKKDGNSPKYLRIAGKMRVLAAEQVGCTVPCYIRVFSSDDEVVSAAKNENFTRRLWDRQRIMDEESLIMKLLSKRTQHRVKNVNKLHPRLGELFKKGLLKYRSDDDLTADFSRLSYEAQESLVETINSILSSKTIKYEDSPKLKEEIRKITEEKLLLEARVKELTLEEDALKGQIAQLEGKLTQYYASAQETTDQNEVVKSYIRQVADLKTQLTKKEVELKEAKNEAYAIHEKQTEQAYILNEKRVEYMLNFMERLHKNISQSFTELEQEVSGYITAGGSKDALLVVLDHAEKIFKAFGTYRKTFMDKISKALDEFKSEPELTEASDRKN